jgi:hypothetical protein
MGGVNCINVPSLKDKFKSRSTINGKGIAVDHSQIETIGMLNKYAALWAWQVTIEGLWKDYPELQISSQPYKRKELIFHGRM